MSSTTAEYLVTYVPALLLRRLAASRGRLASEASRVSAAVLSADITGFTPLTERLAERGPVGAEQLSELLNGFFTELLDDIHAHGGEALWFAGDATLALWPVATEADLGVAVQRAAACAFAIQQRLAGRESVEGVRLRARVGVGGGWLWSATVGEGAAWDFVVLGAPLREAGGAACCTGPDEVAAAASVWPLLGGACAGQPLEGGAVRLVRAALSGPNAAAAPPAVGVTAPTAPPRAFMPAPVLARIGEQNGEQNGGWLAEFRGVSVLFASVEGLTGEVPDALERAGLLMRTVRSVVGRFGGSVQQLVEDVTGLTLVAAWGTPEAAHEDDAARAAHAAIELQAALAVAGFPARMGVATGRAFCGERGSARRREYAITGDVMNRAARLMQAASRDVICDEPTAQAAAARLTFLPLAPLVVKGSSEPVPAFRPQAIRPRERGATTIVGRLAERKRIGARIDAVALGGKGGVLLIEGDAGIGKSLLLEDALERARALRLRCTLGVAEAVERSTPYFVWRDVLMNLLGGSPAAVAAAVRAALVHRPEQLARAPLLNAIVALGLPETEITTRMTAAGRAKATRELLVEVLRHVTSVAPALIVLDDGHWCDSASWALAVAVARGVPRLLLVVATRPLDDPVPVEYDRLARSPDFERLQLCPLSGDDVHALVSRRLGVTSLPAAAAAFVRAKAEGNPFFSEQLAFALRDTGHLVIEGHTCRLAAGDLEALQMPGTVQGVVAGRIDRLTPPQQLSLKVASAIGRVFSWTLLWDVFPVAEQRDALPAHLDQLGEAGLVAIEVPGAQPVYRFDHPITQEVAYDLLTFAQRRQLHRAVATWYEQHHASDLAPHLPLLAHHWTRADDAGKAIGYLERAADQALAGYANREAIRSLETALALASREGSGRAALREARWHWWLGRANLQLADNVSSRRHLERSLALLGRPVPATGAGLMLGALGQVLRQALRRLAPGTDTAVSEDRRAALVQAADLHHELSEIAYFSNDVPLLLHTTAHTLNLAEAAGVDGQLARAYATAAVATGTMGLHWAARFYCRRALGAAARTRDLSARAFSQLTCGAYYSGTGEWNRLEDLLTSSTELFEGLGDRYRLGLTLAQHGYMLLHRGRYARACELLGRAHAVAEPDEEVEVLLLATAGLVIADIASGCVNRTRLAELEALVERNTQRSEAVLGSGMLAWARLHEGARDAALAAAVRATRHAEGVVPPSFYTLRSLEGIAAVSLDAWARARREGGESRRVRHAARAACRRLARFARLFPIGRPPAGLMQGHYRALAGDVPGAHRAWRRAGEHAERFGMLHDAALAHLARARLPLPGRSGDADAARAAALFADLGIHPGTMPFELLDLGASDA